MGADLIIAALATPIHERHEQYNIPTLDHLDWEAGFQAIESLDITEDIRNSFEHMTGEGAEEDEDIRDHLKARLHELQDGIEQGYRNISELWFGDHIIIICGGTTGGDSPDDPFDAISDLSYVFDEVLKPVGFAWPRP